MAYILDISHHQVPSKIDYDKLAKQLDLVIIRTQYGSKTIDSYYKTHHAEFAKRGVPRNAYAWVRGVSVEDMKVEASDFYKRTQEFKPEVWWLDIEERSMEDMRTGIKAYISTLRYLGAKKIGAYIGHLPSQQFGVDLADFDALWIPRYGDNTGRPDRFPLHDCDMWQYTSKGRLDGYAGDLDINMLTGSKPLSFFTGQTIQGTAKNQYVEALQKVLSDAGIDPGPIDGIPGIKTLGGVQEAVRRIKLKDERISVAKALAKNILEV